MHPSNRQYTKVLAVSSDRDLLGNLVSFLQIVGYDVAPTSEARQTSHWVGVWRPDVCLIDTRDGREWDGQRLRRLNAMCAVDNVKIILITDATNRRALVKLLGAGVDDMVEAGVWGELLARLKTVVQLREFEARLAAESGLNPLTQLPTFDRFQQRATELWEAGSIGACLHVVLDFSVAQVELGNDMWKRTLNAAALLLQQRSPRPLAMTGTANGNFQLLIHPNANTAEYAEMLRKAFADTANASQPGDQPLTVSIGLAASDQHDSLDDLLRAAKTAAQWGRKRGGNCCLTEADYLSQSEVWEQETAAERLYATTTAQHLMTPFAWSIREHETLGHAANIFEHAGADWLPVVDAEDRYLGMLSSEHVNDEPSRLVGEACLADLPQIPAELSFESLMVELQRSHSLVVVRDDQPWGIIEASRLAKLDQLTPIVPVPKDATVEKRLLLREPLGT